MADPKQVQIRNMPQDIWKALRVEAAKRERSLSDLVAQILGDWLDDHADDLA